MPRALTAAQEAERDAGLAVLRGDDETEIRDYLRLSHGSDLRSLSAPDDSARLLLTRRTGPGESMTRIADIVPSPATVRVAGEQLRLRREGGELARAALAALGYRHAGTGGWWITAYVTPAGLLGFVNIAKGIACETSVAFRAGLTEALTAPGQHEGPQVSGAVAWAGTDLGEARKASAPAGWTQLLAEMRGGLMPLRGMSAVITAWCLETCYGAPGDPGWEHLDPARGEELPGSEYAAEAGWPHQDPRDWPAPAPVREAMNAAGMAALDAIARQIATGAGLSEVVAALEGDGTLAARLRAAGEAVPPGRPVLAAGTPGETVLDLETAGSRGPAWLAVRESGIARLAWACGDAAPDGTGYVPLIISVVRHAMRRDLAALAESAAAVFPGRAGQYLAPAVAGFARRMLALPGHQAGLAVTAMLDIYRSAGPVTVSIPLRCDGPWKDMSEPVGQKEIAARLGVDESTVQKWQTRSVLPAQTWAVGGRPAWKWGVIREWAARTGRLHGAGGGS
jgi:hypothetical protein